MPRELAKDTGSTVAETNGVWPYRKQTATIYLQGDINKMQYKSFIVEQHGMPIASFDTVDEACAYIEANKLSKAEVYDNKGELVCFYS